MTDASQRVTRVVTYRQIGSALRQSLDESQILASRGKAADWSPSVDPHAAIAARPRPHKLHGNRRDLILNVRDEFRKLNVATIVVAPFLSVPSRAQGDVVTVMTLEKLASRDELVPRRWAPRRSTTLENSAASMLPRPT